MRLVVAEDELLLREGLVRLLQECGFEVVAQAADAGEALRRTLAHRPDAAILDIRMPPTNTDEGLRVAARLHEQAPEIGVLVLSHYVAPEYAMRLLETRTTGIGYMLKDAVANLRQLEDAVRSVAQGGIVVDPQVVAAAMRRKRNPDPLGELSERELDLLRLMAEGRSNLAIAQELFLSPRTVETHVRSIFLKLGLQRAEQDNRRVLAVLRYLRAAQG